MSVNDDQQAATILAFLFIPNQIYVFRAMSSPIIRNTWLYLQFLILSTGIAAGWCIGWAGNAFRLIHDTNQQQYRCKYRQVFLMMGEDIARNTYNWLGINK